LTSRASGELPASDGGKRLQAKPPLARWRVHHEDALNTPGTINLKMYGVRPFIDAARVYSLAHGLPQTKQRSACAVPAPPARCRPTKHSRCWRRSS
jgi:hypothetical protein